MKVVNNRGRNSGPKTPEPAPINIDPNTLEDIIC